LEPRSILIVKLSAIGDIIHAIPAVAALRERFPGSRIDWCVEERYATLVECIPVLDGVIRLRTHPWRRGRQLVGKNGFPFFVRQLRRGRYDVAIDFQGLFKSAVVTRLSGAPRRIGWVPARLREPGAARFYTQREDGIADGLHVIDWCAALVRPLGIDRVPWTFPLRFPERAMQRAADVRQSLGNRGFAMVNPGAGWPTKQWNPERFGCLSARISRELGLSVLVSLGPGEETLAEQVRQACPESIPVCLNLLEFAALAADATIFVGGDTGPMHLASAVGAPVVAMFGPSDPVRNGPFHPRDIRLHRRLPCSGSYRRRCPEAEHRCMNFTVDEVFAAVRRRLALEVSHRGD
jgi:heptosyltransferase-1